MNPIYKEIYKDWAKNGLLSGLFWGVIAMVLGTLLGGLVGTLIGPVGTLLGGLIGGTLGIAVLIGGVIGGIWNMVFGRWLMQTFKIKWQSGKPVWRIAQVSVIGGIAGMVISLLLNLVSGAVVDYTSLIYGFVSIFVSGVINGYVIINMGRWIKWQVLAR